MPFCCYLLAQHPEAEQALLAEIDHAPQPVQWAHLRYTRCLFTEALRCYPPAWAPTEVAGIPLRAQGIVLISQYVTPARWLVPGQRASKPFFPFGMGTRRCIGESLAWMIGSLVLARLAGQWRFRLAMPARQVGMEAGTSLQPGRLIMYPIPREALLS